MGGETAWPQQSEAAACGFVVRGCRRTGTIQERRAIDLDQNGYSDSYPDSNSNCNSNTHGYSETDTNSEDRSHAKSSADARTAPGNSAYSSRAALTIWAKLRGSRLAPPTKAPSMSGWLMSLRAFSGFTLPPY